ncbi:hypothetical protein I3J09_22590 [Streptomyces clavuligerus]|nr:hypothetical protein [Streptomyces clavuligerus]ANW20740.1 hypothetical protein BB341_22280 [Streptomyces clavuligerus]AXU15367.1 hypothetical protein D1794_23170 [Streptomyces clavuligerus]MBY6305456.1 hypothetical protein [Streptomyces clavuligerus]QCS08143.1 hypothetical protein CRV15_22535 [Streptomyces clavuligerus]QPJ92517.1 hypothetical protein GE265_05570 [Streptomyces clavuligerus]
MDHTEADLAQVLHTGPFHLALRTAIAVRGLPLQRVRHHLTHRGITVGVTSLSYWQQGARRPQRPESLRAVRALEELLELPGNSLIRLLGTGDGGAGRREVDRPASRAYSFLMEVSGTVERLLADLEVPADGGLHTVGHHERIRIGAGRELLGRESRQVVRAHRDGIDRYVAIHHGDPGCEPERVRVTALENCRTGRVRRHRETGLVVAELLFDARLRAGETHVLGYGFEDGTGGPSTEYVRGFTHAGGQYVLQIHFDEGALPARCRRFAQATTGAPRGGRTDLTLSGRHRTVHLVEQGVRPGILGIDWDWE